MVRKVNTPAQSAFARTGWFIVNAEHILAAKSDTATIHTLDDTSTKWYNMKAQTNEVKQHVEISIPDLETFEVLRFADKISRISIAEPVIINANMGWVRPFGLLYAVAALKALRARFKDIPFQVRIGNSNGVSYAAHMGFFKSISMSIEYGKEPGAAQGNDNYIPITMVDTSALQRQAISRGDFWELGQTIELESKRLATILSQGNNELTILLTYIIREMIRNVPEHAETNVVWLCGQHWRDGTAEIAIMDAGIGILGSLQKNRVHRQYINDDATALRSCVKAGISQAFNPQGRPRDDNQWSNSGYGLYVVSRLCSYLNGSFCIASGNNYLHIDTKGSVRVGDTFMNGTAVKMTMSIDKLTNANRVIMQIAKEGQEQAKEIRNAFKQASRPSKGICY